MPKLSSAGGTYGATNSKFLSAQSPRIYFTDSCKLYVYVNGIITKLAGTNSNTFNNDNILATEASLNFPYSIALDSIGNIYIADSGNHRIRKINISDGIITTVAGNGNQDFSGDNGLATSASLNTPRGIIFDSQDNMYIVDSQNFRIRKVSASTGIITTLAGSGSSGSNDGIGTSASFGVLYSITIDNSNNLYVPDAFISNKIRKIVISTGNVSTIAGNGSTSPASASSYLSVGFNAPSSIAIDRNWPDSGTAYVTELVGHTVKRLKNGTAELIAGVSGTSGSQETSGGNYYNLLLNNPLKISKDKKDNMYITDASNGKIRKIIPPPSGTSPTYSSTLYQPSHPPVLGILVIE